MCALDERKPATSGACVSGRLSRVQVSGFEQPAVVGSEDRVGTFVRTNVRIGEERLLLS